MRHLIDIFRQSSATMSWSGLLDFNQLPGEMISGLDDQDINEIVDIQQLLRSDASILDEDFNLEELQIPSTLNLPSDVEHNLDILQRSAVPNSTAYQKARWSKALITFLAEKGMPTDFKNMSKSDIDKELSYFYSELKTKDGNLFSPASLNCVRAAIFRYFISPPLSLNMNIIRDKEFSNRIRL